MRANQTELKKLITSQDAVFVIPVYQRNYDWKSENCKQLFIDILKISNNNDGHFVGTICYKMNGRNNFVVIDGQQRITSVMILLKAIHDITKNENLKNKIKNQFLINQYSVETNKLKLKPIKKDEDVYNKLMSQNEFNANIFDKNEQKSNVYKNYILFKFLVEDALKRGYKCENIENAIERLEIVELELDKENPQVIFESLNSTGLDLTNTDLLRNYILMPLDYSDQEKLYKQYWMRIEEMLGAENMEAFMTHYLIYKRKSPSVYVGDKKLTITKSTIYQAFKKEYPKMQADDAETLFKDMIKYACYYKHFIYTNEQKPSNKIEEHLYIIFNILEAKDAAILLLYLYELYDKELLKNDAFLELLNYMISYIFRSNICNRTGLNRQFSTLCLQKIKNKIDENFKYIYELKNGEIKSFEKLFLSTLNSGRGSFSWPKDREFVDTLKKKDLYISLRSEKCKYLFYMLEKQINEKELPAWKNITIEHIMPRSLSKEWKEYLNSKADLAYFERSINTLGNLTLTGYNSELGNETFTYKKSKYRESSFSITRDIAQYKEWTSKEIEKRSNALAQRALKCWKLPEEYNKEIVVDTGVTYSLKTDLEIFSKTKPCEATIIGKTFQLTSWRDFLINVAKQLYALDSNLFFELLAYKGIRSQRPIVDTVNDHMKLYEEIDKNLYIEIYSHTRENLETAKMMVEYYDRNENTNFIDDIYFTLRRI